MGIQKPYYKVDDHPYYRKQWEFRPHQHKVVSLLLFWDNRAVAFQIFSPRPRRLEFVCWLLCSWMPQTESVGIRVWKSDSRKKTFCGMPGNSAGFCWGCLKKFGTQPQKLKGRITDGDLAILWVLVSDRIQGGPLRSSFNRGWNFTRP